MRFKLLLLLFFPTFLIATPGFFEPWGRDSDLKLQKTIREEETPPPLSIAAKAATYVIRFRQTILSPTDGPRSHFRPTSSQYMLKAISKYGFLQGYLMGCDRLMRENSDDWVYRKVESNGKLFKSDPVR